MAVADDLKFNVARIRNELLKINLFISKCLLRLVAGAVKRRFKAVLIMCRSHAASTAACGRLDHYRIADFLRDPDCLVFRLDDPIAPRCHRDAGFARVQTG